MNRKRFIMQGRCPEWGLVLVGGGGGRENGEKGEYSAKKCVHIYVNTKMILVETTPVIRRWG
jgi:hypothetical protein